MQDISINNGNVNEYNITQGREDEVEREKNSDSELLEKAQLEYDPFALPASLEAAEQVWWREGMTSHLKTSKKRQSGDRGKQSIWFYTQFFLLNLFTMVVSILVFYDIGFEYRSILCARYKIKKLGASCPLFDIRFYVVGDHGILTKEDLMRLYGLMGSEFAFFNIGIYIMVLGALLMNFWVITETHRAQRQPGTQAREQSFTLMANGAGGGELEERITKYLVSQFRNETNRQITTEQDLIARIDIHSYSTHLKKLVHNLKVVEQRATRLRQLVVSAEASSSKISTQTYQRVEENNFKKWDKLKRLIERAEQRETSVGMLENNKIAFITFNKDTDRDLVLALHNKKFKNACSTYCPCFTKNPEFSIEPAPHPTQIQSKFIGSTQTQSFLSLFWAYIAIISTIIVFLPIYFIVKLPVYVFAVKPLKNQQELQLAIITLFNYFFAKGYFSFNSYFHDRITLRWQVLIDKHSYLPWKIEVLSLLNFFFAWGIIGISSQLKNGVFEGFESLKSSGAGSHKIPQVPLFNDYGALLLSLMIACLFIDPIFEIIDLRFIVNDWRRSKYRKKYNKAFIIGFDGQDSTNDNSGVELCQEELNQIFSRAKSQIDSKYKDLYYLACIATLDVLVAPLILVVIPAAMIIKFLTDLYLLKRRFKSVEIDMAPTIRYSADSFVWIPKFFLLGVLFLPSDPGFVSQGGASQVLFGVDFWVYLGWIIFIFPTSLITDEFGIWYSLRKARSDQRIPRYFEHELGKSANGYSLLDSLEDVDAGYGV